MRALALLLLVAASPAARADDLRAALDALRQAIDTAPAGAYPLLAAALATHRPQPAIEHVTRRLAGKQAARQAADRAVRLLQHVLPAERFAPLLARCRAHGDPWIRLAAADYLLPRQPAAGVAVLDGIGSGGPRLGLQCLILALRQRAAGLDGWPELRRIGREQIGATRSKTWRRYRALLVALLEQDAADLRAFLADGQSTAQEKAVVWRTTFALAARFDAAGKIAAMLVPFLRRAAADTNPADAFVLAATAHELQPGPTDLLDRLWDPSRLTGPFGAAHAAAFAALADPALARKISPALLADLLARRDHGALVTTAAATARHDPPAAHAAVARIADPAWRLEGLRAVHRAWAAVAPAAALKLDGVPAALRRDVQLDAAVGAARADPALALRTLLALPDHPDRFEHGICLVAPALPRHQAVRLLLSRGKPSARALIALAWTLLDPPARAALAERQGFADRYYPVDRWPGAQRPTAQRFATRR